MKYASPVAFRNALEARLKTQQTDAIGLSRLRKRIVFERLLARIHAVAPDRWVLKGGFALELRLGLQARTTKDVDVDWTLDEPAVTELLLDAADHDLDDHFAFTIERLSTDLAGGGQRWTVLAELAGREFERVAIDIGHDRPPVIAPDSIATSQLLEFAGVAPISVPALAIEQHLAEKLHAYTRRYAGNAQSSRVKDLVDIVVIAQTTPIDGDLLLEAVDRSSRVARPTMFPGYWSRRRTTGSDRGRRSSPTFQHRTTSTPDTKKQMPSGARCSLARLQNHDGIPTIPGGRGAARKGHLAITHERPADVARR